MLAALAVRAGAPPAPAATAGDTARLLGARISLLRAGDTARVDAAYRLLPGRGFPGDSLALSARRLRGQELRVLGGDAARLRALPGLWRVTVPLVRSAEGRSSIGFRYRTIGRPDRVPVFIPAARPPPAGPDVRIRVAGRAGGVDAADAFPRFESAGDGTLVARPSQLPGIVHLPSAGGGIRVGGGRLPPVPVGIAADVTVWLVGLLGIAAWALVRRRA